MCEEKPLPERDFVLEVMNEVTKVYWGPLNEYLKQNPNLVKTFPAFLLMPEHIVLYLSRYHLAIEYYGKEKTEELPKNRELSLTWHDFTDDQESFFDKIIGFEFISTAIDITLPLPPFSEDLIIPTNDGADKLIELKWNFGAQDSIMSFNSPSFHVPKGQFCRIVNGRFFDADENGLKTRHIQWIDFIPLTIEHEDDDTREFKINLQSLIELVEHDAHYVYPLPPKDDFKFSKLPIINRFIELIGDSNTTEVEITQFLEQDDKKFILSMGILSKRILSQVLCEWQSSDKLNLLPDFFIQRPNGYVDIVEFKLPKVKNNTVVGRNNREAFSAEINSYIAQTRVYKEYFEDPKNREWFENRYDVKVRYPKRILVVGRRWDFSSSVWKEINEDYKDVELMTFDDLIDGVVAQFYM